MKNFLYKDIAFACLISVILIFSQCSKEIADNGEEPDIQNTDKPLYVLVNSDNVNLPGGGKLIVEHSDSPKDYDAGKLVDNDFSTVCRTESENFSVVWLVTDDVVIRGYSLVSTDGEQGRDPSSWTLSASDDNENWKELDRRTDFKFGKRNESVYFGLDNPAAYKYYKLQISGNNGAEYTELAEWIMDPEIDTVIFLEDGNGNIPDCGNIIIGTDDSPYGYDISNVVDGDYSSDLVVRSDEFDIVWESEEGVSIASYSIVSSKKSAKEDPASWKFYGSRDGNEWLLLDTRTSETFKDRNGKQSYFIADETAYRFFKLSVTSNNGGDNTRISEYYLNEVFPGTYDIEDIMHLAESFTESSKTPMGKHYEGRHVTTDDDLMWLADASNEPDASMDVEGLSWKDCDVTLYPFGTPLPADINQTAIGDCSALSVMASMAYMYPDFIKSIIRDNGDKTYDVAMFDPQGNPVTVSVSSRFMVNREGKLGAVAGKNGVATWATVLEKAIMKYNCIYKVNVPIYGIGSEHAAPLFTGNGSSFSFQPYKLTADELARAVLASLRQGKIIVGGFRESNVPVEGTFVTVNMHAYSVMKSANPDALFAMRNPWGWAAGSIDGKEDGTMNIFDDGKVPPTIDIRVMDPGVAAEYAQDFLFPYVPPVFSQDMKMMKLSPQLERMYFGSTD